MGNWGCRSQAPRHYETRYSRLERWYNSRRKKLAIPSNTRGLALTIKKLSLSIPTSHLRTHFAHRHQFNIDSPAMANEPWQDMGESTLKKIWCSSQEDTCGGEWTTVFQFHTHTLQIVYSLQWLGNRLLLFDFIEWYHLLYESILFRY